MALQEQFQGMSISLSLLDRMPNLTASGNQRETFYQRNGRPESYISDYYRTLKEFTMEEIVLTTFPRAVPQSRRSM